MRCRRDFRTAAPRLPPAASGRWSPAPRSDRRPAGRPVRPAPPPARRPASPAPCPERSPGRRRPALRWCVAPRPGRRRPRRHEPRSPPAACGGRSGARRRWLAGLARCARARPAPPRRPRGRPVGSPPPRRRPRGPRAPRSGPRSRWRPPRCAPGSGWAVTPPPGGPQPGRERRAPGRWCPRPGGRRRRRGLRPWLVAQSTVAAPPRPATSSYTLTSGSVPGVPPLGARARGSRSSPRFPG